MSWMYSIICYNQGMPKFLYTIFLLAFTLWVSWFRILLYTTPNSALNIFTFLFLFFASITITTSIIFYFFSYKKAPDFTNLRLMYRKTLKWSSLTGFIITGLMGFRAFELFTPINVALFLLLCAMIAVQIRGPR